MKERILKSTKSYGIILFGLIIVAIAVSNLYVPNKIVSGGVSGMGTILYHTLGIPTGLSFGVINLIFIVIGIKVLGKKFIINTVVSAGVLSVLIEFFAQFPPITTDPMLATIFGSILYGFGIGLTLVQGASSGGTDILGRIFQHFFPQMPIGKLLLIIDGAVILTSLVVFGKIEYTLYGIIALAVSTYAIDLLIQMLNISKLAFVMTDKGEEIAKKLVSTSPRGVTIIDAVGAYTMENRKMLVCALKANEITDFQHKILEIDPTAFIIFSESQQIVGNGFYVYK